MKEYNSRKNTGREAEKESGGGGNLQRVFSKIEPFLKNLLKETEKGLLLEQWACSLLGEEKFTVLGKKSLFEHRCSHRQKAARIHHDIQA